MDMFIEVLKAFFIGVVEGITEWLPISSTGHMILVDEFVKLNVSAEFLELFLVVIQLGAIMAVLILYFHKMCIRDRPWDARCARRTAFCRREAPTSCTARIGGMPSSSSPSAMATRCRKPRRSFTGSTRRPSANFGTMASMETDPLAAYLAALARDDCYRVDEVLKTVPHETTEVVYFVGANAAELGPFVRKRIAVDAAMGDAYGHLFRAQRAGRRFRHLPRIYDVHTTGDELVVVLSLIHI